MSDKNFYPSWNDVPDQMTVGEAKVLLQLSEKTIRKYCKAGTLPGIKIERQWRIDKKKLMAKLGC